MIKCIHAMCLIFFLLMCDVMPTNPSGAGGSSGQPSCSKASCAFSSCIRDLFVRTGCAGSVTAASTRFCNVERKSSTSFALASSALNHCVVDPCFERIWHVQRIACPLCVVICRGKYHVAVLQTLSIGSQKNTTWNVKHCCKRLGVGA